MTRTKYYITRFSQFFGAYNRNRHLNAAASETQLYVDAQRFFGAEIWTEVEDIEEVASEYWSLKDLVNEREKLLASLQVTQESLDKTQEARKEAVKQWKQEIEELEEQRKEKISSLARLRTAVHDNRDQAKKLKHSFEGLKVRLKVLTDENADSLAIEDTKVLIDEKKGQFTVLKGKNETLVEELRAEEGRLEKVQERITKLRKSLRERALKTYSSIGDANKKTSEAKARIMHLDKRIARLYTLIARYVLNNIEKDRRLRRVIRNHRLFYAQIRMLENSIRYQQQLADLV